MIPIKDLRIGDLVKTTTRNPILEKGSICKVVAINAILNLILVQKSDVDVRRCLVKEEIEGVPLTPEILEKNGWQENSISYDYSINDKLFFCSFPNIETGGVDLDVYNNIAPESYDVCQDDFYLGNISFVHQLQHILWALGLDANLKI